MVGAFFRLLDRCDAIVLGDYVVNNKDRRCDVGNTQMTCEEFQRAFGRVNECKEGKFIMSEEEARPLVQRINAHAKECGGCDQWMQLRAVERTDFGI